MSHLAGQSTNGGRIIRTITALLALAALAMLPVPASAQDAPVPVPAGATPVLVSGGVDNQTDPHISGTLVTYTNSISAVSEIRYHDLATGQDAAIPTGGHRDSLSDVYGSTVVFRRIFTDGSSPWRPIMTFDAANPTAQPVEVAPDHDARRSMPRVGGSTVAWEEQVGPSSNETDIVVHDRGTGVTTPLTNDAATRMNREPAVSPDGSVVAWASCLHTGLSCDVRVSSRSAGDWSAPVVIGGSGEEIQPVTDGSVVVYTSNDGGDRDIHWANVDGSGAGRLSLPGHEWNPSIDGGLISFESEPTGSTMADLFVYDLATGTLYQVTDTPGTDELLSDLSVAADGTVRLVWAQPDGTGLGDNDIYAASFQIQRENAESYTVCPLFDQDRSYKLKRTIPIKLQLCDAAGKNLSSPDLVVTATGLGQVDGSASTDVVEDAGNANPDNGFRYDAGLGGYIYNLKTTGLSAGTWELRFTVAGDPATYSVRFDLR